MLTEPAPQKYRAVTVEVVSSSMNLDGAGRRLVETTRSNLQVTDTLTRHYTDASDNPAWTVDAPASGASTVTRYASLTGDGLGMTIATSGSTTTAQLDVADPLGNIVSTITVPATGSAPGLDSWSHYTEYGQSTTPAVTNGVSGVGYGWLGSHERATLAGLGLVLMGARLYNQATGLFTSLDPQYQGGDTWYGYPTDPINHNDLDGNWWGSRFYGRYRNIFTTVGAIMSIAAVAFACVVCGGIALGLTAVDGIYAATHHDYVGLALDAVGVIPAGGKVITSIGTRRLASQMRDLDTIRGTRYSRSIRFTAKKARKVVARRIRRVERIHARWERADRYMSYGLGSYGVAQGYRSWRRGRLW